MYDIRALRSLTRRCHKHRNQIEIDVLHDFYDFSTFPVCYNHNNPLMRNLAVKCELSDYHDMYHLHMR